MYRISKLLGLNQKVFHTSDLAVIWGIKQKNTLYTAIKRYVKAGVLFSIQKGFYSVVPVNKIDPMALGAGLIHSFCYLSTETVLFRAGIIMQNVYPITFISSKPNKFKIGVNEYLCRQLKDDFLFNSTGISEVDGILTASISRAVADMLYFNPKYHFDNEKEINWPEVKSIQKEVGYL